VRAKSGEANLTSEGGIALGISETLDLVMERGGPDVRIVGEARDEVVDERLERIRARSRPDSRCPRPVQIRPDRLSGLTKFVGSHRREKVALTWLKGRVAPKQSCYYATL